MNTSSLYMDNIFPKLATNFAQIIGDYYEKTTIHFFLSLFVAVEGYAQKTLTLKDCLEIGIENKPVLGKQTQRRCRKANMEFPKTGQDYCSNQRVCQLQ